MDETQTSGAGWDSWLAARVGNAIDAATDRALNRPQLGSDPGQAYGVDQNGRIYTLGQTNGQIQAQVQTGAQTSLGALMPWLIIGAVVFLAVGSK
jgi:hypothetical protein